MLVPFTKSVARATDDDESENKDDVESESEDGEANETEKEVGREAFDDMEVEEAMKEVSTAYIFSEPQVKVAKSSLTKVCVNLLSVSKI